MSDAHSLEKHIKHRLKERREQQRFEIWGARIFLYEGLEPDVYFDDAERLKQPQHGKAQKKAQRKHLGNLYVLGQLAREEEGRTEYNAFEQRA